MITEEDCWKKAAQWQEKAGAASDATTSANMRRVSEAWITLAKQIGLSDASRPTPPPPVKHPRELAESRNTHSVDFALVANVLRKRLHLDDTLSKETSE
jgi:hypothetical protein